MTAEVDERGARTRQREATRDKIVDTAISLLHKLGYSSVTTGDIAAAAGVSPRTFFRHFPGGKEEIMVAEARATMRLIHDQLLQRPAHEPPLVAIRQAIRTVLTTPDDSQLSDAGRATSEIAAGNHDLMARMLGEYVVQAQSMTEHIALRLAADPRNDVRPALISQAIATATQAAWFTWAQNQSRPVFEIFEEAMDFLEAGLAYAASRPGTASTSSSPSGNEVPARR